MAANIFQNGGVDNNFGTVGNWSLGAVPLIGDGNTATFNAASPNCVVNTSTRACNNITFNGYLGTITMTNIINVGGTADFTGMTAGQVTGAAALVINTASSITGGGTWGGALSFSTSSTKTITGTLTVVGLFTSSTNTQTVNGGTLVLQGGLTMSGAMTGSTQINLDGGTWTGNIALGNSIRLSSCTLSGLLLYNTGTITYGSGVVATAGSTLTVGTAAATFNCSSVTWNNITIQITNCTLSADLNLGTSGTFTVNLAAANMNGSFNINCGSNFTLSGTTVLSGAPKVVMTGAGTITIGSGSLQLNLDINASGTIVFTGTTNITGNVIHYITAAGVTTTGNTLACSTNTTLNTDGIIWNNITLAGASKTYTLTSKLDCTGTLNISGSTACTFVGAFNITCGSMTMGASGMNLTLSGNITGTGTFSTGAATTSTFNGAFNINWSGTVTIGTNWAGTATLSVSGTTTVNGGTTASIISMIMNWTSGTITTSTGFVYRTNIFTISSGVVVSFSSVLTLNTSATVTINATGITINTISCGGTTTQTINGSQGITIGTLTYTGTTATSILNLKSGNTYVVTTSVSTTSATAAVPWLIKSSTGGVQAILTINQGATMDLGFVNATDIDSSAGITVYSYRATLSNTNNWSTLPTIPVARASASVS